MLSYVLVVHVEVRRVNEYIPESYVLTYVGMTSEWKVIEDSSTMNLGTNTERFGRLESKVEEFVYSRE